MSGHSSVGECSYAAAAPGFRARDTGALNGVGNYGYSYASTPGGTNSLFMWFNAQHLDPCDTYYRAYGRQLRCLSE
ncbi:hypothetical protein [uncultured Rikenella sp.]|uniref:hypothetical protein n=1 Tax=uncultured Rikenella sp. TaxID=368003 RepID=UPI00260E2D87|nr:hypothetical protein [uncultured Rikenella sp.]